MTGDRRGRQHRPTSSGRHAASGEGPRVRPLGGTIVSRGSGAEPFSNDAASHYVSDEGTIPWPSGVSGSEGATTMNIAEISEPAPYESGDGSYCTTASQAF